MKAQLPVLSLFLLLFCGNSVFGQDAASLHVLFGKLSAAKGKERVNYYNRIASALSKSEPDRSIQYADSALILAGRSKDRPGVAEAYLNLGVAYSTADRYDSATYFLRLALSDFDKLKMSSQKAKVMNQMGLNLQAQGKYDRSLAVLDSAVEIYQAEQDLMGLSKAYNNISNTYLFKGRNNTALRYAEKALTIRRKILDEDTVSSFMNLGIIHMNSGDYPTSLSNYLKALNIFSERKDTDNISQVHSNLGILYLKMEEYEDSYNSFQIALQHQEAKGYRLKANKTHNNLGLLLFGQGRTEEAFQHYLRSLEIIREIGSDQDLWTPLLNLGYYYCEAGDHEKGIKYLKEGYDASDKTGSIIGRSLCATHLASSYSKIHRKDSAIAYAENALRNIASVQDLSTREYILYTVYSIYEALGDDRSALKYFKDYVVVKDSLMNQYKADRLAELQTLYELDLKDREIENLNAEANEMKLSYQLSKLHRIILWVSTIVLAIISILIFALMRIRLRSQRMNYELLEAKATGFAKQVAMKNEIMEDLKLKLSEMRTKSSKSTKPQVMGLFKLLETNIRSEQDWDTFLEKFSSMDPTFFDRLQGQFPELSNMDIRLAALVRLRLSNKEIAKIAHIEVNSVKQGRYRLKKKLNLSAEQDLVKFLCEL